MPETRPPRVFVSFAGNDRGIAQRLRQDLAERGIEVPDFPLGENLVLNINRELEQSEYFVLLWSQAAAARPYVGVEWSAAFTRALAERRAFLFIVRLDAAPLPALLASWHYLDATGDGWDKIVEELVTTWLRDRAVGEPVLPAPVSPTRLVPAQCTASPGNGVQARRDVVVYVRNRALSVAHVIAVPEGSAGWQLVDLVRAALRLPDAVERFGGTVGMRFYYRLTNANPRIADGDIIDLEVRIESFGPDGSSPLVVYRDDAPMSLAPAVIRSLINSAFGHLIPR